MKAVQRIRQPERHGVSRLDLHHIPAAVQYGLAENSAVQGDVLRPVEKIVVKRDAHGLVGIAEKRLAVVGDIDYRH